MTDEQKPIDWDRLCNAPAIIFFQRWFIGVGIILSAASLVAAASIFADMRDATRDLTKAVAQSLAPAEIQDRIRAKIPT